MACESEKEMSLQPQMICPVPEETARIARAAYPRGNVYLQLRDELGTIYQDQAFAHLFSPCSKPALARLPFAPRLPAPICGGAFRSSGGRCSARTAGLEISVGFRNDRSWF